MSEPIKVTPRQNTYLKFLADGAKDTQDFVYEFMVSAQSVGKMMRILRDKGLVETRLAPSTGRGGTRLYSLIRSYDDLDLTIVGGVPKNGRNGVTDEEILYVAIIRNAGYVGQRLTDIFRSRYPERTHRSALNIVSIAKERGLC